MVNLLILLHVTLDLKNSAHTNYIEILTTMHPFYINTSSNHPPNIIRQHRRNIGEIISEISSSKEIFDRAAPCYNDALKARGYKEKVQYEP